MRSMRMQAAARRGAVLAGIFGLTAVLSAGINFKNTPVIAEFRCPGPVPCTDRIAGDGAPYVGDPNSQQGAYLDSSKDLYLVVNAPRTLTLDFSAPVAVPNGGVAPCSPPACPTPLSSPVTTVLSYPALVIPVDPATGGNLQGGLPAVPLGATYKGRLKIDFPGSDSSYFWTIRMNGSAGAEFVSVTRNLDGTFTIGTDPGTATAALFATTTARKQVTYPEGYYSMPFQMTVCPSNANGSCS